MKLKKGLVAKYERMKPEELREAMKAIRRGDGRRQVAPIDRRWAAARIQRDRSCAGSGATGPILGAVGATSGPPARVP